MSKANTIGAIILGAAAGVALVKYFSMPQDERTEFMTHLKNRAVFLLLVFFLRDNCSKLSIKKLPQRIFYLSSSGKDRVSCKFW